MVDFGNPFSGMKADRKLSKEETIRAMRFLVAAEFEAVQMYVQLSESIDDELAKEVLVKVANEERVHAGEFLKVLFELSPDEKAFLQGRIQRSRENGGLSMGFDVYLRWDGMTEAERKAQITGFSVEAGYVGYLREAYHGEPYALRVLFPEYPELDDSLIIQNSILKERLPETIKAAIKREEIVYNEIIDEKSPIVRSFVDFVDLHCEKEDAGLNPKIIISY